MFSKFNSLLAINFTLAIFTSSFIWEDALAQNKEQDWNQEQCIEKLVKEGLKTNEANIWCGYQKECLAESQKEGLALESATTVCECTISEFRSKYSTKEFKELTDKVDSDKQVAKEFRDVGEKCFEKILFE